MRVTVIWSDVRPYAIRIVGDPVLRKRSEEVTDIDERLVALTEDMFATMYEAPGIGLAAPRWAWRSGSSCST